jgi:hypothetical protein
MRIGMVCYAVRQGLGYLAKSFYDNGIVDEVLIYRHPARTRPTQKDWYPSTTPIMDRKVFKGSRVDSFLDKIDAVMFFETPFDWEFLNICKDRGVKTVLIPMYEWFPTNSRHTFDKVIAPSLLDQDYFPNSTFIPIPVETKYWKQRTKAIRFLHNAGNVGCLEHKGTRELLEAMPLLKSKATVTVRAQDAQLLAQVTHSVYGSNTLPNNLRIEPGEIPYENLWNGYDTYVAPEKFNGLSLPLQEARAAGMLVLASDRYPANTWLPKEPLIPVHSIRKTRVSVGSLEVEESVIEPLDIAVTIDKWYERDISNYSLSGREWALRTSWKTLRSSYLEELEQVCQS